MIVVIEMERMKYVVAELKRVRTATTELLNILEKSKELDFDLLRRTLAFEIDDHLRFLSHKSLEEWKKVAMYPDVINDERTWQEERKRSEKYARELIGWTKLLIELFADERDREIYMALIKEQEEKLNSFTSSSE